MLGKEQIKNKNPTQQAAGIFKLQMGLPHPHWSKLRCIRPFGAIK